MKLNLKRRGFFQIMLAGATVAGSVALGNGSVALGSGSLARFGRSNGTIRSSQMKMHVFVDKNDNIVAITPAPVDVLPSGRPQAKSSESVVFGGSSPAQQLAGMKRYELDMKELSIDIAQVEVEQLHQQVITIIKARPELKPVYV